MQYNVTTAAPQQDTNIADLPRWDLSRLFPGLHSPEFKEEFASLTKTISDLEREFERLEIGWGPDQRLKDAVVADFEQALQALNSLNARHESMTAYLSGRVTTDSRDDEAQARFSELQQRGV